ncbi:MAG: hypothetical protein HQL73_12115 [Magnetococcales bacterium]|nr:hypothetical protein [Magnetococcales bacterium]
MHRNEREEAALEGSLPERRSNPYDHKELRDNPLGVFIVENGFQVCETHRGICPVPAVSDWARAMEQLDVLTMSSSDRCSTWPRVKG